MNTTASIVSKDGVGQAAGDAGADFHQGAEQDPGSGQVVPLDRYNRWNQCGLEV